jgi:hypothetical protein
MFFSATQNLVADRHLSPENRAVLAQAWRPRSIKISNVASIIRRAHYAVRTIR